MPIFLHFYRYKFPRYAAYSTDYSVAIAIEKGIINPKTIIVDATHTVSHSNPYSPVEILKLRSRQLRKSLYDADDTIKDNLPDKNGDDNMEHELDYTRKLLKAVASNEALSNIPKIKERLNMLKAFIGYIQLFHKKAFNLG